MTKSQSRLMAQYRDCLPWFPSTEPSRRQSVRLMLRLLVLIGQTIFTKDRAAWCRALGDVPRSPGINGHDYSVRRNPLTVLRGYISPSDTTQCHAAYGGWAVRWIWGDSGHSVHRAAHAARLQGALSSHPKLSKTVQQRQNCVVYLGFSLVCG